jgi:hypothetical protein
VPTLGLFAQGGDRDLEVTAGYAVMAVACVLAMVPGAETAAMGLWNFGARICARARATTTPPTTGGTTP